MRLELIAALIFSGNIAAASSIDYHAQARRLARVADARAQQAVIAKALKEIDRQLKIQFPQGPFTREDVLAFILSESGFWHLEINRRCVGELGLMQVRPEAFRKGQRGLLVKTNIEMGIRILKQKHATAKRVRGNMDLKKATIICYNGWKRDDSGRVKEGYWRWWSYNRKKISRALYVPKSKTIARKPKPSPIQNAELARQLEESVYGGRS